MLSTLDRMRTIMQLRLRASKKSVAYGSLWMTDDVPIKQELDSKWRQDHSAGTRLNRFDLWHYPSF